MAKKVNMTEGHPGLALLKLVLPIIPAAIGIVAFNLVDTFFVGKLGSVQLAAMSFSFPIVIITGSLANGIGIGASSSVSQYLGKDDYENARIISTDAMFLGLTIAVSLSILGVLTIDPFFTMMGASEKTLVYIRQYMTVWYLGMPFAMLPMIGQHILQAIGDTKTPGMLIVMSVTFNIILDPLLIFGIGIFPELGIQGAAFATVISRGFRIIIVWYVLFFRDKLLDFKLKKVKELFKTWGHILFVGIPAAMINIILPISQGVLNRFASNFGTDPVAAMGIAMRIQSFAIVFMIGLSMILTPFVGQNFGAKRYERVKKGFNYSSLFSIFWSVFVFIIFLFFGRSIVGIFTQENNIIDITYRYLIVLSLTYGFQGIVVLASASFNGLRKPLKASIASLMRVLVFFIPLAYIGMKLIGLNGIFYGVAIANVISGIIVYLWFIRNHKVNYEKAY